jgi:DNA helicase-2/ATP-dependent DNA helicase PcrA
MIADGVNPSAILLFTFTRKAANEMKDRMMNDIGDVAKHITICTYHSFCSRILRKYAEFVGWDTNFSIYDEQEKSSIIDSISKNIAPASKRSDRMKTSNILGYISKWKEQFKTPDMVQIDYDDPGSVFAINALSYYREYAKIMREQNAFDFDDLLLYGFKLISEFPTVLEELQNKYTYITADESQDSSENDLSFILKLGSKYHNICLIMDNDQAIYAFRGANINNVIYTLKKYKFTQYNLDLNFRSTQNIVNASRSVIDHNETVIDKDIYSKNTEGNKVFYYRCNGTMEQAMQACKIINATKKYYNYKYSDFAILCRMSRQTRMIEDRLLKNKIPYRVVSGTSFYTRKEIRDIISYLRIAYNPFDALAFERSATVPKQGIGAKTIETIEKITFNSNTEYDTMERDNLIQISEKQRHAFNKKTNNALYNYTNIINELRKMITNNVPADTIIKWLINHINYRDYIKTLEKNDKPMMQERLDNLDELIGMAQSYETFKEFIENIVLYDEEYCKSMEVENDEGFVQIITMHSAKGLEFKNVLIVGANQGIVPHKLSMDTPEHIEEERRLFYVAMTRAKENLFILNYQREFMNGYTLYYQPSMFVNEIDENFIEQHTL